MASKAYNSKFAVQPSSIEVEEKISSLFEPDTSLAANYFDALRRKTILEPEKRLLFAVMKDAIDCYQVHVMAQSGKRQRLFRNAEEWIMERDGDWVFSFVNICDLLQLHPEYLRQGLLRWKDKKLADSPTPGYGPKQNVSADGVSAALSRA
ncbi:MAG TPA: hypothetical protein VK603_00735 [Candidatus Saccharimonadales bacterium]|nr:hypothetical protein [Candidatus Saccharimonadales bacterium]